MSVANLPLAAPHAVTEPMVTGARTRVPRRQWAERVFDVSVAGTVLLLLSLPMLLLALAISLESRGRPLFRQRRVGKDGVPFVMLKFRTMVDNAEELRHALTHHNEVEWPLFKMRRDPRVTRVGRVLRRLSLDELPQLWNVIRGDMSLVGPRPALPDEVVAWPAELRLRLGVKPGITGPWQVSERGSGSFEVYSKLDLQYVDRWSLRRDLRILARTVPAVVRRTGAY